MKKILIIGSPGAGKSYLAVELGKVLSIPVIHLDKHFWQPGWERTAEDDWRDIVSELVARDKWIIDGNYHRTFDIRIPAADTIIYLDFNRFLSVWRIIKRVMRYHNKTRPDMSEDCPDRIDFRFLKWAWNFPKDIKPENINYLNRYGSTRNVIVLRNSRQITNFLKNLKTQALKKQEP
jgi:adenylate kinase family enzyme